MLDTAHALRCAVDSRPVVMTRAPERAKPMFPMFPIVLRHTERPSAARFCRSLLVALCVLVAGWATSTAAFAQDNYRLATGDAIRIVIFQNPDMTLETRVSEDGSINYPLVGAISIGQLDIGNAEKKIAKALKDGGFLKDPQVNIQLMEIRGNKVAVLGQVNKAGSYPIQTTNTHVSQMLAEAGGQTTLGADQIVLTGTRDGKPFRREIDIDALYRSQGTQDDVLVAAGDTIYVPRAPMFYIYGEVLRPGEYRVQRGMTMRQAIAAGGGLTLRGTERRLSVVRADGQGAKDKVSVNLEDAVRVGDVVYVTESLF